MATISLCLFMRLSWASGSVPSSSLSEVREGAGNPAKSAKPFCAKPQSPLEQLICSDDGLLRLNERLKNTYQEAKRLAQLRSGHDVDLLDKQQRHWVTGLSSCLKEAVNTMCLEKAYLLRISELQALWDLAPSLTPLDYNCNSDLVHSKIQATFYRTRPATVKLTMGNEVAVVHQESDVSAKHYVGQGVEFWFKGKEANVTWHGESLLCLANR